MRRPWYSCPTPTTCACGFGPQPSPFHCACGRWKRSTDALCEVCAARAQLQATVATNGHSKAVA